MELTSSLLEAENCEVDSLRLSVVEFDRPFLDPNGDDWDLMKKSENGTASPESLSGILRLRLWMRSVVYCGGKFELTRRSSMALGLIWIFSS